MDKSRVISANVCASTLSFIPTDFSLVDQPDEEVPEEEAQAGKEDMVEDSAVDIKSPLCRPVAKN